MMFPISAYINCSQVLEITQWVPFYFVSLEEKHAAFQDTVSNVF